ncbi:MAG: mevalonate kinase family protein [Gammaproteobacteria bacterium]
MQIIVSAPGKMVLSGEYAVLHGAPALALAIRHRAHVLLKTRDKSPSILESSLLNGHMIPFQIGPSGIETYEDPPFSQTLPLVNEILAQLVAQLKKHDLRLPPIHMVLDTNEFYRQEKRKKVKLGLGSSAALLVALSAACNCLFEMAGGQPNCRVTWPEVWRLHQSLPNQHGSGIDVASSYHGQLILFQKKETESYPSIRNLRLPSNLYLWMIWTRRSTETSSMLDQLARWRCSHPELSRITMDQMFDAAQRSADMAEQGRAGSLLQSFRLYADALQLLSDASGIDIISSEHREIRALAEKMGLVYKPSGAGGGDIGFAATDDIALIAPFQHKIEALGYHGMAVPVDSSGFKVIRKSE